MLQSRSGHPRRMLNSQSQSHSNSQAERPPPEETDVLQKACETLEDVLPLVTEPPELESGQFQAQQVLVDKSRREVVFQEGPIPQDTLLNVYNLNQGLVRANEVAGAVGGAFHVGVQVYGSEWTYGVYGLCREVPRTETAHVYACSIYMGRTQLNVDDFAGLLLGLVKSWCGADYELFSNNCCSFANVLCEELGVGLLPSWVDRVPRLLHGGREAGRQAVAGAKVAGRQAAAVTAVVAQTAAEGATVAAKVVGREAHNFAVKLPGRAQAAQEKAAELGQNAYEEAKFYYSKAQPHLQEAAWHARQAAGIASERAAEAAGIASVKAVEVAGIASEKAVEAAGIASEKAVAAWISIREHLQSDDLSDSGSPTSSPSRSPYSPSHHQSSATPDLGFFPAAPASWQAAMPTQNMTAFHQSQRAHSIQGLSQQVHGYVQQHHQAVREFSTSSVANGPQQSPPVSFREVQHHHQVVRQISASSAANGPQQSPSVQLQSGPGQVPSGLMPTGRMPPRPGPPRSGPPRSGPIAAHTGLQADAALLGHMRSPVALPRAVPVPIVKA